MIADLTELLKTVFLGLALFLPLANPLTAVAVFLGLSNRMGNEEIRKESKMAAIYVFIIMVVCFYAGSAIMNIFGISIPGLRIAGGLIVAFIGFRMLFPQADTPAHYSIEAENKKAEIKENLSSSIAFVPLAMPSTAGPGTIAMIITTTSSVKSGAMVITPWVMYTSSLLIPLILSLILWISLLGSRKIMAILGKSGIEAISRLMGFLLVCMGIQFVINGVQELSTHIQ